MMKVNLLFIVGFQPQCSCFVLTFYEKFSHVTAKISPDVNNSLIFLYTVQELSDSLPAKSQVTLLRNLWSVYKICKSDKNFISFNFHFTISFSGYLQRCFQNLVEHLQGSFLQKYLSALSCIYFRKKKPSRRCSTRLKIGVWAKGLKY